MSDSYIFISVGIMAGVTIMLRFLPFLIFGGKRKTPKVIEYLSSCLPCAIMGMLVVYCLKDVSIVSLGGWLPALIGVAAVVLSYIWKRNTLMSIVLGTACYMILIRVI